jgi:hypothetical protein
LWLACLKSYNEKREGEGDVYIPLSLSTCRKNFFLIVIVKEELEP